MCYITVYNSNVSIERVSFEIIAMPTLTSNFTPSFFDRQVPRRHAQLINTLCSRVVICIYSDLKSEDVAVRFVHVDGDI